MKNFVYEIPTRVYFGPDCLENLGAEIKRLGTKLLFVYDGDYIKANGVYDAVINAGKEYGFDIVEFTKVKPNPRHTDVQEGVNLCKKEGCDVILAVGGGSTIDSSKVISSCAVLPDVPVWDVVIGKIPTQGALPLLTISTISATGSEMNRGAVISNLETNDKQSLRRVTHRPKVSFLNPNIPMTVPKFQTACGSVDIMCHTIENYFCDDDCLYMLDTVMEGIIRTVYKYAPIAYNEPKNYEARANLMWASPWAINELIMGDKGNTWTIHPIEHEISAYYDITHGLGLAILMPRWLRHIIDEKSLPRFRQLGIYAFDLDRNLPDREMAEKVIETIEEFSYKTLGLTSNFTDLGIDDKNFEEIAGKLATDNGYFSSGYRKLSKDELVQILKECL